jgi:flagellar protein FlgJ
MKIDNMMMTPKVSEALTKKSASEEVSFEDVLKKAKESGDETELRKAVQELESVFINMMMKTMRSSIQEEDGFFKKSESEKMFEGMLDEEYAKKLSEAGGIGLTDLIVDQLSDNLYNEEDEEVTSFELKG